MKMLAFASRNTKELVRDTANLFFGIAFPVILLLMLSFIGSKVPNGMFGIKILTPGMAVFGLSFISLFSGMLIAKDRSTSFLIRLFASPLSASDFILGYTLPVLPMAIAQIAICFIVSFFLGMPVNVNILVAIIVLIPTAVLFIAIGLLAGSLLTDKQVGGVCGALLTNLSAWLSGAWIPLDIVGGAFKAIAYAFPFVHAVNSAKAAVAGNYNQIFPDLLWVIVYAIIMLLLAIYAFNQKMSSDIK